MAAIDFPTATSNGQTFEADSGVIYTYVGTPPNGFWSGTFGTTGLTTLDGRYIAKNDSNNIQTIQTQGLKFNSGNADTILIDGLNSRIGIGTTSPGKLLALQDSSTPALGFYTGATLRAEVNATSAETSILSYANSPITFNIGGSAETEAVRIDSSGRVGIGTTSPSNMLHIEGSSPSIRLKVTSGPRHMISPFSGDLYIEADPDNSSASTNLIFTVDGGEAARIDSSKRLLVGTSSSLLQGEIIQGAGSNESLGMLRFRNDGAGPEANFYKTRATTNAHGLVSNNDAIGTLNFRGSDGSSYIRCALIEAAIDGTPGANDMPGRLVFSTTADGASSPTERIRIDSSGAVGVGTSAPTAILHTKTTTAAGYILAENSSNQQWVFGPADATYAQVGGLYGFHTGIAVDLTGKIGIGTTAPSAKLQIEGTSDQLKLTYTSIASYIHEVHSNGDYSVSKDSSERIRIDSSGELLVGTTHSNGLTIGFGPSNNQQNGILYTNSSPYTDTDIYGCGVAGTWRGRIKFYTSNNSAASLAGYVDEEGNLALGRSGFSLTAYSQTSGDGQWVYRRSVGSPGFHQGSVIQSTNADGGWSMMYLNKFAWNTGDDLRYIDLYKNGATHARLQLTANGANVELTNQSDYRLKENIETYTGGLDTIKALRVRQFDWISNPSYPYKTVGFIAHEVDEILDDIVTGVKDGTRIDEGGNEVAEYQSLDQSRLVPYLTSALQEAIAKIETLELPNENPINIRQTTSLLNNPFITFLNSGGDTAGSIIQNGVNSVTYATSSDYRLKDNVVELTAAIPRLKQLAPKRFNFIAAADVTVDGFLAHEAQAVVPEAVTGSHNQVDGDGNPVMQGIDQSKLVPLLTAALQEAIGRIETLETKVATLEGN